MLTNFLNGISLSASLIITIAIALVIGGLISIPVMFRRVVKTNEVHIVQSGDKTKSYGKDTDNGNVYYAFPSWLPMLGVSVIILPTSVFAVKINNYEAYDKDRLPFVLDLTAFFRVSDSNRAAQRVSDFQNMNVQLTDIIQGSVRSILSSLHLNDILQERSGLGEDFTKSVKEQLKEWGIEPVKTIELMDIRDNNGSQVIHDIMEIKKSYISRESRVAVAENAKVAQLAEIEAQQIADVKRQEAQQIVGLSTVNNRREVALSEEKSKQDVAEQQRLTTERQMEIKRVAEVQQAIINKEVNKVQAEQEKEVLVIAANASKEQEILNAEAAKQKALLDAEALIAYKTQEAEGIKRIGEAEAESKRLAELALVAGNIELAKEIGGNENYQEYLKAIRHIESHQAIGVAQAEALKEADMKFIINDGKVDGGINRIGEIFSSSGGTKVAAMLEGLNNSPLGKQILANFLNKGESNHEDRT